MGDYVSNKEKRLIFCLWKKNSNEYFFLKIHTLYILHTLSMIYTLEMIKLAIDKRSNNALLLYKQGKQTANPNNLNKNILGKIKIFKVFSFFLHGITNLYRFPVWICCETKRIKKIIKKLISIGLSRILKYKSLV